jgi:hypothetical protein
MPHSLRKYFIIFFICNLATADKALVFCFADNTDNELCKPYYKLSPQVFSSTEVKTIPKEFRYNPEKLEKFICNSYKYFFEKESNSRVTTFISAHGKAIGSEEYYKETDKESGREVRGDVKLFLSESQITENKEIDAEKIVESINKCLQTLNQKSTLVVDACHSGALCKAISKPKKPISMSQVGVLSTCLDCTITGYETFVDKLIEIRKRCAEVDTNKDGIVSAQEYANAIHKERGFGEHLKKKEALEVSSNLKSVTRPSEWSNGKTIPLYAGDTTTKPLFACTESLDLKKRNIKEPEPQHYNSDGYQYLPFKKENH